MNIAKNYQPCDCWLGMKNLSDILVQKLTDPENSLVMVNRFGEGVRGNRARSENRKLSGRRIRNHNH